MSAPPDERRSLDIDRVVVTTTTRLDRAALARLPDLIAAAIVDRRRGRGDDRAGTAVGAITDRVVSEIGGAR